jgi:hypothetical protein
MEIGVIVDLPSGEPSPYEESLLDERSATRGGLVFKSISTLVNKTKKLKMSREQPRFFWNFPAY